MLKNLLKAAASLIFLTTAACMETVDNLDSDDYIAVNAEITEPEDFVPEIYQPVTQPPTEPFEMPKEYKVSDSAALDVDVILQNPELPTGCEITSLAVVLNYCGFDIDKVELCDNFLRVESEAKYTFDEAYIGNPKSDNGFGCYAPVIADAADKYFKSIDAQWRAMNLTGTDFEDLFYQIEKGRPVVIWASMGLKDVKMRLRWKTESGEEAWFPELEHCMVLTGYNMNEGIVYAADPLKGNMEYSMERFENVYEQLGRQAVIIYEEENSGD